MSPADLHDWLQTSASKEAGWRKDGDAAAESVGHERQAKRGAPSPHLLISETDGLAAVAATSSTS